MTPAELVGGCAGFHESLHRKKWPRASLCSCSKNVIERLYAFNAWQRQKPENWAKISGPILHMSGLAVAESYEVCPVQSIRYKLHVQYNDHLLQQACMLSLMCWRAACKALAGSRRRTATSTPDLAPLWTAASPWHPHPAMLLMLPWPTVHMNPKVGSRMSLLPLGKRQHPLLMGLVSSMLALADQVSPSLSKMVMMAGGCVAAGSSQTVLVWTRALQPAPGCLVMNITQTP